MAIVLNTRELLRDAFGSSFPDIPDYDMSKTGMNATGKDALGRSYFMDVELESTLLQKKFRLPNEPLVRVSKQKNLVKTVIVGNEQDKGGIAIEQVNQGNYRIDIRGIILNKEETTPEYPQDQVRTLVEFAESGEALDINCDLLENLFSIRKIVIEDYSIDSMQGRPYSQLYTLNCISYEDFLASRTNKELL